MEAQALGGLGEAEFVRGHMISAFEAYDACIALARREGDLRIVAANLSMRGQTLNYKNELEAAFADCREADLLAQEIRHARAEMIACVVSAYVCDSNDPLDGRRWSERALEIARRLGAGLFEAIALEYIGRSALQQDRPDEAEGLILQALEILQESDFGQRFLAARAQGALALATRDEACRKRALEAGEALLAGGAPAHNHLWFYRGRHGDLFEAQIMAGASRLCGCP